MDSQKTRKLRVHATTETTINTDKCIILTSTKNEGTDEGKTDGSDKSEENVDDTDPDLVGSAKISDKVIENSKKKEKKKRKKKKNKKTNMAEKPNDETVNARRNNVKLAPLHKPEPKEDIHTPTPAPVPVHSGCLGFITSWLAKRKEKRREKKRQAIRARYSHAMNTKLMEFEHKRARGGVAFTIELDSRPLIKPLLPPIKTKSGPAKLCSEEKLQKAEKKRQDHLMRKRESVRAQEEKRQENAARKADNDRGFKQKAALTIMAKQGHAKRNQCRMERERRCTSSLRRATSVMSRATSGDDDSLDNNF